MALFAGVRVASLGFGGGRRLGQRFPLGASIGAPVRICTNEGLTRWSRISGIKLGKKRNTSVASHDAVHMYRNSGDLYTSNRTCIESTP